MSTKTRILSHEEIQHKVRRIAYQIYESNMNENQINPRWNFKKRLHFC